MILASKLPIELAKYYESSLFTELVKDYLRKLSKFIDTGDKATTKYTNVLKIEADILTILNAEKIQNAHVATPAALPTPQTVTPPLLVRPPSPRTGTPPPPGVAPPPPPPPPGGAPPPSLLTGAPSPSLLTGAPSSTGRSVKLSKWQKPPSVRLPKYNEPFALPLAAAPAAAPPAAAPTVVITAAQIATLKAEIGQIVADIQQINVDIEGCVTNANTAIAEINAHIAEIDFVSAQQVKVHAQLIENQFVIITNCKNDADQIVINVIAPGNHNDSANDAINAANATLAADSAGALVQYNEATRIKTIMSQLQLDIQDQLNLANAATIEINNILLTALAIKGSAEPQLNPTFKITNTNITRFQKYKLITNIHDSIDNSDVALLIVKNIANISKLQSEWNKSIPLCIINIDSGIISNLKPYIYATCVAINCKVDKLTTLADKKYVDLYNYFNIYFNKKTLNLRVSDYI